eukprot:235965_1
MNKHGKKKGKKANKKKQNNPQNTDDGEIPNKPKVAPIQSTEENKILNSKCQLLAEELIKSKDESCSRAKLATKLQDELRKHDLQTTEMVAYLQNEIHQKDAQIEKLRNTNYSLKSRTEHDDELTQKALDAMDKEHATRFNEMQQFLASRNTALQRQIESLQYVEANKAEIENALLVAKATMEAQGKKFKLSIDRLESKYIVDTQRIRERTEKEITNIKNRAKELAEQELDGQSRSLRVENKKMKKDLAFHSKTTSVLHCENEKQMNQIQILKRNIELWEHKDIETSKQSVEYKKRIKDLNGKLNDLRCTFDEATKEWEDIRNQMMKQFDDELRGNKLQNKTFKCQNEQMKSELVSLRYYSNKLIAQRTEIEQFFHESLDEVKERKTLIRLRNEYAKESKEYAMSLNKLGLDSDSIADQRCAKDEMGIAPPRTVEGNVIKLEDLNLEEKEHVLKVLISKINISQHDLEASIMKNQVNIKRKTQPSKAMDANDYNKTFLTQKQI